MSLLNSSEYSFRERLRKKRSSKSLRIYGKDVALYTILGLYFKFKFVFIIKFIGHMKKSESLNRL